MMKEIKKKSVLRSRCSKCKGKRNSGWIFFGVFIFALLLTLTGKPERVQAATKYKAIDLSSGVSKANRTVGGVTFQRNSKGTALYAIKGTKKTKIASSKLLEYGSGGIGSSILSNGKTVYYTIRTQLDSGTEEGSPYEGKIYSSTVDGKNKKEIGSLGMNFAFFAGYYDGKVYFVKGSAFGELYTLNPNTKEITEVYSKASFWTNPIRSYGRYLYLYLRGQEKNIAVFDCKTLKLKILGSLGTSVINGATVSAIMCNSKYVWYIKGWAYSEDKSYSTISIVRCKLNGSAKKTIVKDIKVKNTFESGALKAFTNHSITYVDPDGNTVTKKF